MIGAPKEKPEYYCSLDNHMKDILYSKWEATKEMTKSWIKRKRRMPMLFL